MLTYFILLLCFANTVCTTPVYSLFTKITGNITDKLILFLHSLHTNNKQHVL